MRVAEYADRAPAPHTWRLRFAAVCFVLVFTAMGVRAGHLVLSAPEAAGAASAARALSADAPRRADIVDRNGEILASTLTAYSLFADPREVWDPAATAAALAGVLPDLDVALVQARLEQNRRFVWVKRGLTPRQREAVFALGLPGLGFREELARVYPRGRLAAHVLGFTDVDGRGVAGAEAAFDAQLSAAGAPDLRLSLDIRAQYALDTALRDGLERTGAKAAVGLITDVTTGEILALTSLPDFDPHDPAAFDGEARVNRALAHIYELGSVMKTITFALAADVGVAEPERLLPVHEALQLGATTIRDPYPFPEPITVRQAFVRSSNVGAARLALEAGEAAHVGYLTRFGLLARAPVGLSESAAPLVPAVWDDTHRATVAYGHGLAVSPAAFMAAFGAAVNGGVYREPTLRPADPRAPVGERVLEPRTSAMVRDYLRATVEDGTGRLAAVPGYQVGGKTGTARKAENGEYVEGRVVSSFSAVFPTEVPRYGVLVLFDEPDAALGKPGAAHTAAPVTGAVIARLAVALGVPGEGARLAAHRRRLEQPHAERAQ